MIKLRKVLNLLNRKPNETTPMHTCPRCGAGLTALYLVQGGIINNVGQRKVKAIIGCRSCQDHDHNKHKFIGDSGFHFETIMRIANHTGTHKVFQGFF